MGGGGGGGREPHDTSSSVRISYVHHPIGVVASFVIGVVASFVIGVVAVMVFVSALVDYFRPLDPDVSLTPSLRSADGDMFRLDELGNPYRIPNADRSHQWPTTSTESNATEGDELYDGDDESDYREKPKILRKLRSLSVILESVRTFSLLIYLCKKIVWYVQEVCDDVVLFR